MLALLLLSASAIPSASAPHEWNAGVPGSAEADWEALPPLPISPDGDNITMRLRGFVGSMGNHTALSFTFNVLDLEGFSWWPSDPDWWNVTGEAYEVPFNPFVEVDVSLEQGKYFEYRFTMCLDPPNCTFVLFADSPVTAFTVPTLDEFFLVVHPLRNHVQNLGIPVDITLGVLGLLLLFAPLGIVTVISRFPSNQELIPIFLIGLSANIFLRFWPAILVILVGLLCGWMLADFIPRGGTADNPR